MIIIGELACISKLFVGFQLPVIKKEVNLSKISHCDRARVTDRTKNGAITA